MILRFNNDLTGQDIYAHGEELAQIMGRDKDEEGRRVHIHPETEEMFVASFENPVLMTDNYKIAQLEPTSRDSLFALFGGAVKVIEYDGTSLRFEQRRFPGVWGLSIDTLLFCNGLRKTELEDVKEAIEIGCGSGFIAKYVVEQAPSLGRMSLADLNPHAIRCAQENISGVETDYHIGDAISYLQGKKFDLIVCNPPYIPRPSSIDDNPYEGIGLLNYLIMNAHQHLTEKGKLITNISSLCESMVTERMRSVGVSVKELASMEVPLKVYNVLNDPQWMEYLLEEKGLKKEMRDGYEYWQRISVVEIKVK